MCNAAAAPSPSHCSAMGPFLSREGRGRAACLGARDMACSAGRTAEREAMPDPTLWGLFVAASIVLLLTPGPAALFLVARSVEQGRAAGPGSGLGRPLRPLRHNHPAAVVRSGP